MRTTTLKEQSNRYFLLATLIFGSLSATATLQAQTPVKNVVLVHGAFADGSGWKGVYNILTKKGYHVTIVQNALASLEDDVAATNEALDRQDGPTILVGHSWGGTVITQAGNHPKVVGLVYVAAFQPDNGETTLQWIQTAPPAPENGILPPNEKGIIYYDEAKYHAGFCADLPEADADFMYASQGMINVKCFVTPVTKAAWRDKPAYGIIPADDKSITPSIMQAMYKRSNTKVTEVKGSHVFFISQPKTVADVIVVAAKETAVKK